MQNDLTYTDAVEIICLEKVEAALKKRKKCQVLQRLSIISPPFEVIIAQTPLFSRKEKENGNHH